MRHVAIACLLLVARASVAVEAAPAATVQADGATLDAIVVSGEQPGPGLWKVSKGEHVLWVLGTLSPLPKRMHWQSKEVEARIAESQEVLLSPNVAVSTQLGFFGKLALLPSLIGARDNPDRRTLADVVPSDQYARWRTLKARYIGRNGNVEKWRPMFAAMELYRAAIRKSGLVESSQVSDVVRNAAKHAGVKLTPVKFEVELADPKAAIKEFKRDPIEDLACFTRTLDRIDRDLGTMTARANAWASGDLDALRSLPYTDQMSACREAVSTSGVVRKRGFGDIEARVERTWIDAASAAIERNRTSFALLPMRLLLGDGDYLAALRARGYAIEGPDGLTDESTVGTPGP
jgi:uncharacterized protein YbaP (TraB family)